MRVLSVTGPENEVAIMFQVKAVTLAISATIVIWLVFATYFQVQSRRHFNVNFVPLNELYVALALTLVVWAVYFVAR